MIISSVDVGTVVEQKGYNLKTQTSRCYFDLLTFFKLDVTKRRLRNGVKQLTS